MKSTHLCLKSACPNQGFRQIVITINIILPICIFKASVFIIFIWHFIQWPIIEDKSKQLMVKVNMKVKGFEVSNEQPNTLRATTLWRFRLAVGSLLNLYISLISTGK